MRIRRAALSLVVAALLVAPLASCAAGSGAGSGSGDISSKPAIAEDPSVGMAEPQMDSLAASDAAPSEAPGSSVIRSGDVSIQVADPGDAVAEITEIAENLDGFVESQTVSEEIDGLPASGSLLVRVPDEKFEDALAEIGDVGEVISKTRSTTDVTTQRADLSARVEALKASVARLTELMAGAATTSELIEAETALSQRQQELDGLQAQLDALEGQVDQASIWVNLSTESSQLGGPSNFWEGILAGFASIAAAASGLVVLIGILLPWLLLIAVVTGTVVFAVRARRRRSRNQRGSGSTRGK